MDTNVHVWSYLAQFFLEWEMFQMKVVEKIKAHILCSLFFFENHYVCVIVWETDVEPDMPQVTEWGRSIA
jgi:hypothetical protein